MPRRGLTLAELLVVIAVLAVLGSLVLPAVGRYVSESRDAVTRQSLVRMRDVISLYWSDMGQLPGQVRSLFVNPNTGDATADYDPVYRRGWRGPYLVHQQDAAYAIGDATGFTHLYGQDGDPAVLDGWGHPLVIQHPGQLADGLQDVRIVSAGPDGVLSVPPAVFTRDLTADNKGDDVWVAMEVR